MADESFPLTDRFPRLQPGKRPGGLGAVNGFGTTLIGRRDADPETGTYVVTHVATALFVPVWALGAYRVATAEGGGWYCLGREPLSGLARACNALLVLAVAAAVGGIWWTQHTKSPEYAAGQKLRRADEAAAAGHGGEAARLCREVMDSKTSRADAAGARLAEYIADPPGGAGEAAAVYEVAVELHANDRCPVPNLFDRGKALAERYKADDPAPALALLEVIAPYAPDPKAELALRRQLLERQLARAPEDLAVAGRLGAVYEQLGQREVCEKLLAPLEARLGTTDGAAVLGRVYAARGAYDKAHALLAPYVAARLPAYRAAEKEYVARMEAAQAAVIDELKADKAPGFDAARARKASKADQMAMVDEYINDRLKDDPTLRAARRKLMAERGAVGAVLELGLVQVQRAQAMTDPAAKRAGLEAAEKTLLSVSTIAGKSDEYRLSLGQVYYWLGRRADGKRAAPALLSVAHTLREVGETAAARQLVEEAYGRETDPQQKFRIAMFRSVLNDDLDDQILWLGRADPNAAEVQAALAQTRGRKAEQDGKDGDAADQYREAIAVHGRMPETTATLDPKGTISLLNGASVLAEAAARDTVGTQIDFRALKSASAWEGVGYVYRTPAEWAAVSARFAGHPGAVKARAYLEKLLLLAPRRDDAYQLLAALCEQTDDVAGLTAVAGRAAKADFDTTDAARRNQEFLSGKKDAQQVADAKAAVARAQAALAACRPVGGRTLAAAVGRYVQAKTAAWVYGEPADPDELVKLADEVHATPSAGTESTLVAALYFRAHLTLARENEEYAKQAERTKRSFGSSLVSYVLAGDGPLRAAAAKNPDVKRLAALAEGAFGRYPDRATAGEWVVLRAVGSAMTAAVAEKARANPRAKAHRALARATAPHAAATALDEYRDLLLEGKEAEAKKAIAALAARGVRGAGRQKWCPPARVTGRRRGPRRAAGPRTAGRRARRWRRSPGARGCPPAPCSRR
jgi:hypothetical protein